MWHVFIRMIHYECRQGLYPSSNIKRFEVPENKVAWNVEFPEYKPVEYTAALVKGKPWADPEIGEISFKPKWNSIDGKVNRKSYTNDYDINKNGYPLNPIGRTGIFGRGLLGRWGPNHAVDPIVTRWKSNVSGSTEINKDTKKPILQLVAIQRQDSGKWAIPGGMIDPGETVSTTLKREFMEEALSFLEKSQAEKEELEKCIRKLFERGEEIFKGYVDDPRNTDNAWIETVAVNFHDDNNLFKNITLKAGDDARNVKWVDIDKNLKLYASHSEFIKKTVLKHNAHW
ncbi:ADP-ribose pyrophosphatase, mitochondrial isoform X1 [Apis laboriosa]|uniref:ADP-ribose pyrophosphatase, mitochondrial isoform X1 n=1 Tax=Apis laboriosa TaxID=183418 RepID=UPI001CC349F9|nr:ADP-ribose pyrophosphatase, mitochondrial isoform X1 [Apis laboriosa]